MEKTNLIKPIFDRVLLKKQTEQTTQSGVLIPKASDDRSHIMSVVAVGDVECVAVGARVIVAKYAGTEVNLGGENFTIVCERDILGVANE